MKMKFIYFNASFIGAIGSLWWNQPTQIQISYLTCMLHLRLIILSIICVISVDSEVFIVTS
jgi:hypothetical protein